MQRIGARFLKSLSTKTISSSKRMYNSTPFLARQFTGYDEPEFLVHTEDSTMDASKVSIPILTDEMKAEIYAKHVSDPLKWTALELSKQFKVTEDRAKAVITIMKIREKFFEERQFNTITEEHQAMYNKYLETNKQPDFDMAVFCEPFQISADECLAMMERVKEYNARAQNENAMREFMEETLDDFDDEGVDTSFKEIYPSMDRAFFRHYNPELILDEEVAQVRKVLIQRILDETEAFLFQHSDHALRLYHTLDDFYKQQQINSGDRTVGKEGFTKRQQQKEAEELLRKAGVEPESESLGEGTEAGEKASSVGELLEGEDQSESDLAKIQWKMRLSGVLPVGVKPKSEGDKNSRWKYAFSDISLRTRHHKKGLPPLLPPTMIRTRNGGWRPANPLEELNRSWTRKPSETDWQFYKGKFLRFQDQDQDDHLVKTIPAEKLAKRKQLKAEQEAAAK